MDWFLHAIAAVLIVVGLCGALVPILPGIPLMFGGMWLAAAVDRYRHLGRWWLLGIALVGAAGVVLDLVAGALGAARVGASRQAVWGALIGTGVGFFLGLPGIVLGPFVGALVGQLSVERNVARAAEVGMGAWIGLIFGTVAKLTASLVMLGLFALGWW
ncbi:MAG TPA: DUF456 domain-containing protein, partial [Steroidobacteraceae bacterium]|jgi:hypothetical protein|nr:DUF456 domain-containing protein [Steroidobacteraceae bacterium]